MIWSDFKFAIFESAFMLIILVDYLDAYLIRKKDKRILYCACIICMLSNLLLLILINRAESKVISTSLGILFLTFVLYKGEIRDRILTVILFIGIDITTELLIYHIYLHLSADITDYILYSFIYSKIILLIIIRIINLFTLVKYRKNLWIKCIPNILIIVLCTISLIYRNYISESGLSTYYISSVALFILNYTLFKLLDLMPKQDDIALQNNMYRQQLDFYEKERAEQEATRKAIKRFRHDHKNYILGLKKLAEARELEQIMEFLNQMDTINIIGETDSIAFSGNIIIDGIINSKYQMAREYGIRMEASLEVPEHIPFHNADISLILGNALDNAIEASSYEQSEMKQIKVSIKLKQDNLMIKIENTYNGITKIDEKGNYITLKKDKSNHGIGLGSIQMIVEKYKGLLSIKNHNNVFTLNILLYSEI